MLQNRRFERIQFAQPVAAHAGTLRVLLIDVSPRGFKVHHNEPLAAKGEPFTLRFAWNGATVRLQCVTMWTMVHRLAPTAGERPTLSSGLRIETGDHASLELLAAMVQQLSTSTSADPAPPDRYLICELVDGSWQRRSAPTREQPHEGFTVSAGEEAAQVERLCAAYASGDGETRKLIRTLAALSIKQDAPAAASSRVLAVE